MADNNWLRGFLDYMPDDVKTAFGSFVDSVPQEQRDAWRQRWESRVQPYRQPGMVNNATASAYDFSTPTAPSYQPPENTSYPVPSPWFNPPAEPAPGTGMGPTMSFDYSTVTGEPSEQYPFYTDARDYNEDVRRWNAIQQWNQAMDQFNMGLSGRQMNLAEAQTAAAADQWARQFDYTRQRDYDTMDLQRELQAMSALGRSLAPQARFVRNWRG